MGINKDIIGGYSKRKMRNNFVFLLLALCIIRTCHGMLHIKFRENVN